MLKSRYLGLYIGLVVGAVLGAWVFFYPMPHPWVSCLEVTFGEYPLSDDSLVDWLTQQEGVVAHTVHIHRNVRNSQLELRITFMQTRRGNTPPFPDFAAQCERLGYRNRQTAFYLVLTTNRELVLGRLMDLTCRRLQ